MLTASCEDNSVCALFQDPSPKGHRVQVGSGAVLSIKRYHGKLYLTCGRDIVVVKISDSLVERRWEAIQE